MQQFMYYQMAAAAAQPFAFHPFMGASPYGPMGPMMPPYGMFGSASLAGGQRQLQEDQQSMLSYHFDNLDSRSERNAPQQRKQSNANSNQLKNEPLDNQGSGRPSLARGLLMEDPNQTEMVNPGLITT